MSSIQALDPTQLHELAKSLNRRDATHWSQRAQILGRIQDERLFTKHTPSYSSVDAYAREELDLSRDDFLELVKLWELIKRCSSGSWGPFVERETWANVPKTRALLIRKAMGLRQDARYWIERAAKCKTTERLEQEIAREGKQTPWTTFSASIPVETEQVIEESLVLALSEILREPNPDPARAKDRDVRGQCLEVVAASFIASHGGDNSIRRALTSIHGLATLIIESPSDDIDLDDARRACSAIAQLVQRFLPKEVAT